nr:transposase [Methylorubrum aminovorans]
MPPFSEFQFVVTDFANLSPKTIFQLYQKRGNMENFIKEMKTGFFADKTDSHSFLANKARLALSFLLQYHPFDETDDISSRKKGNGD